ncbi:hypothetical protein GQ600_14858 [Phytophthora cactorum]|nr:hypothetical protein GQ600_14858 [Phytophthora cactorum]
MSSSSESCSLLRKNSYSKSQSLSKSEISSQEQLILSILLQELMLECFFMLVDLASDLYCFLFFSKFCKGCYFDRRQLALPGDEFSPTRLGQLAWQKHRQDTRHLSPIKTMVRTSKRLRLNENKAVHLSKEVKHGESQKTWVCTDNDCPCDHRGDEARRQKARAAYKTLASWMQRFAGGNRLSRVLSVDTCGRFYCCFLSLGMVIEKQRLLLPVYEVDGTHMKNTEYNGICVLLIGHGGNKENVLLAIGLIHRETTDNFAWCFANCLAAGLDLANAAVFCDRGKQLNAQSLLAHIGLQINLVFCKLHIAFNVASRRQVGSPVSPHPPHPAAIDWLFTSVYRLVTPAQRFLELSVTCIGCLLVRGAIRPRARWNETPAGICTSLAATAVTTSATTSSTAVSVVLTSPWPPPFPSQRRLRPHRRPLASTGHMRSCSFCRTRQRFAMAGVVSFVAVFRDFF